MSVHWSVIASTTNDIYLNICYESYTSKLVTGSWSPNSVMPVVTKGPDTSQQKSQSSIISWKKKIFAGYVRIAQNTQCSHHIYSRAHLAKRPRPVTWPPNVPDFNPIKQCTGQTILYHRGPTLQTSGFQIPQHTPEALLEPHLKGPGPPWEKLHNTGLCKVV